MCDNKQCRAQRRIRRRRFAEVGLQGILAASNISVLTSEQLRIIVTQTWNIAEMMTDHEDSLIEEEKDQDHAE